MQPRAISSAVFRGDVVQFTHRHEHPSLRIVSRLRSTEILPCFPHTRRDAPQLCGRRISHRGEPVESRHGCFTRSKSPLVEVRGRSSGNTVLPHLEPTWRRRCAAHHRYHGGAVSGCARSGITALSRTAPIESENSEGNRYYEPSRPRRQRLRSVGARGGKITKSTKSTWARAASFAMAATSRACVGSAGIRT